jgi:hypothetical protein
MYPHSKPPPEPYAAAARVLLKIPDSGSDVMVVTFRT